jgi:hypothetical protein
VGDVGVLERRRLDRGAAHALREAVGVAQALARDLDQDLLARLDAAAAEQQAGSTTGQQRF